MQSITTIKNWATGTTPDVLKNIHDAEINIAIYERGGVPFEAEIACLLADDFEFKASGDTKTILDQLTNTFDSASYPNFTEDIKNLLDHFKNVTAENEFRLLVATVKSNMCRRFHTDVNDLRMLCTYIGPGTEWLSEENINRKALDAGNDNRSVVVHQNDIRQVKSGDVTILKGALYPNNDRAVVHRSPTIETAGIKRLLLRIDTNTTKNLWV